MEKIRSGWVSSILLFVLTSALASCDEKLPDDPWCKQLSVSNLYDPNNITTFELLCSVPLEVKYWQGITTDLKYLYLADHGTAEFPGFSLAKYRFDGTVITKAEITKTPLFSNILEWYVGDISYDEVNEELLAVIVKPSYPRKTKVISIDPRTLEVVSIIYETNTGDNNNRFYGTGVDVYNNSYWISYEAYSTGGLDYIDQFDRNWNLQKRYTVEGLTEVTPKVGNSHIQGIDFKDGSLWMTLHPNFDSWTYRGSIVKANLIGGRIEIVGEVDLSGYGLRRSIGQGIQWFGERLLLNGLHSESIILIPQ